VDNSPLPSNDIVALEIKPNGELFILTSKGLVSFQSNSSDPQTSHSNVRIFPNPIRLSIDNEVVFSGLVASAQVKITDINGRIVNELDANGSTTSWNLLDYNNRQIEIGIYLLFSSDGSGNDTFIGKLAVTP
jgi:hypothetical protein